MEGRGEEPAVRQFGIVALLQKPFYVWDLDLALHAAFDLRRPYLMNALPAYYEAEAQKTRERLAETAAAYARRTDPAPRRCRPRRRPPACSTSDFSTSLS